MIEFGCSVSFIFVYVYVYIVISAVFDILL